MVRVVLLLREQQSPEKTRYADMAVVPRVGERLLIESYVYDVLDVRHRLEPAKITRLLGTGHAEGLGAHVIEVVANEQPPPSEL